MRSSRPNRCERRASRFSRTSHSSSGSIAGGMLAIGALASAFHCEDAIADVIASTPQNPRSSQASIAPRVTILQPSYADLIKGTTQIVIAVETKGAATKSVEMFIDGVSATGGAASLAGLNSAQFDWKTTTVKDGLRRLTVRVTDESGLRGEAETQVYINNSRTADKTPPSLKWENVRDGELLHGHTKLQLGASDNFGVKYIVITVNPIDQPDRTPALRASLINRAPFEYSLDTTRLPDGVYVLNARATDMLGNEGSTQRVTFGVTNNGLNPTVVEQLDEVLAAQNPSNKPVATSTRSADIATKAQPKLQPKAAAPKAAAPKVAAPKAAAPAMAKPAPVRSATSTIKARVAELRAAPSIAASRPVIERPALTTATNARTLSGAAMLKNAPLPVEDETTFPTKIGRVDEKMRFAEKPRLAVLPKTTSQPRVSTAASSGETFAMTVADSATSGDIFVSTDATQDVSEAATGNEVVTQRAQTPQVPTRLAKLSQTRAATTTATTTAATTIAITTSQNVDEPQITSVESQSTALAMASEKTLSPNEGDDVSLPFAPKLSLAPSASKASASKAVPAKPQSVRVAQLTMTRPTQLSRSTSTVVETKAAANVAITPTAATTKIVETRVASAVSETSHVALSQAKTPQRLAALPTRRDDAKSDETFGAALSAKVRSGAAITVSPVTIAALQMRGSQTVVPASYIVKKGETLSMLAARYGLHAETLANVNGLKKNSSLSVGQRLNLPRALKVSYLGHDVTGDVQAVQIGDVSAAPFRFLFEQQGGTMTWDEAAQRVTANNGSHHVSITIGSREATVGDQTVMMDLAAFLLSGRTMVPVRFFEKAFDTKVEWEPATSRIYVAMANDSVLNR